MKKQVQFTSTFTEVSSFEDLTSRQKTLVKKAREVNKNAYAPYSGFLVSAAILLENNEIIIGTNQENIAYPSGLCAERVALFTAGTNFPNKKIIAMAVTATSKNGTVINPIAPCGGCRQVMVESETRQNQNYEVIMFGENEVYWISDSARNLVPFYFSSNEVAKLG